MEEMSYMFSFTIFQCRSFLPCIGSRKHFSFSHRHYKNSCCSSNKKKMSAFFLSLARHLDLSLFFSLSFAGLPPTFSFSLSFSCFNLWSKLNTLDNTDTETISTFRFRLYGLFSCLCITRHAWLCDCPPK